QRRRLGGRSGNDDRIVERAVILEDLHDLRHRRALLANRDVDAIELLALVAAGIDRLLIEDRIDDEGGLSGLTVADDQLALATADRHQAVDGLQARLHRLMDRFARDDSGGLHLDALTLEVAG